MDNDYSNRVAAIIRALREDAWSSQPLRIAREGGGDAGEGRFLSLLVEDRAPFAGGQMSYQDYVAAVLRESMGPAGHAEPTS
jgi:hypothetical protein